MYRSTNSPISKELSQTLNSLIHDNTVKVSRSCDFCKAKKVKCDQSKPYCDYCVKHNKSCVYSKVRKSGIKPGYRQHVLDKLENIETSLDTESSRSRNEMDLVNKKLLELENKIRALESSKSFTDTLSPQNIDSDKEELPGEIYSTSDNSVQITTSSIKEITNIKDDNTVFESKDFPTIDQIEKLIEIFFDKIHPIIPILHPVSTIPKLLACTITSPIPLLYGVILCSLRFAHKILQEEEIAKYYHYCKTRIISNFIGLKTIEELQTMTLLAFDLFGKSNNPETWSVISIISSGAIHLNLTKENKNITDNSKLRGKQGRKYFYIKNLNSAKDPTTRLDEESRRVLFWEIYMLDKLSSLSNSFPFKIPEYEISCSLPTRLNLWISGNMGGNESLVRNIQKRNVFKNNEVALREFYDSNCFLIEVTHILGEIHSFMRHPLDVHSKNDVSNWQINFDKLEQKISSWRNSIPLNYLDLLENDNCLFENAFTVKDVMFHALYHTMIIRLNSTPGFPYFNSDYFFPSELARHKCLESAFHIIKLSRNFPVMFNNIGGGAYEMCGPQYAFAVWVCARLIFVNAVYTHTDIPLELDYLIGLLTKMGAIWEGSLRYANILRFLKEEELFAKKSGMNFYGGSRSLHESLSDSDNEDLNDNVKGHPKNVRIISDMRLNAYSLDVLLYNKIEKFKQNEDEAMSESNENDFIDMFEWFKVPITSLVNDNNT